MQLFGCFSLSVGGATDTWPTCVALARASVPRADRVLSALQLLPVARTQLARVPVRVPVAAAHFLPGRALAEAFGEPLTRRMFALQPVSARRRVSAAARLSLSLCAHQAAAAAVRHVTAGAAGARTRAHVAARRTLRFGLCGDALCEEEDEEEERQKMHFNAEDEQRGRETLRAFTHHFLQT